MADTGEKWVKEMKDDLRAVASSINGLPWEDVQKKYTARTKIEEPAKVVWGIMSSYMVGREWKDREMVSDAKRILSVKVSDLEDRLPWYELMFDLMDRGRFCDETDCGGAGPWYFELETNTHEELTDRLARETNLNKEDASWAVRRLANDMGYLPGAQYKALRIISNPPSHRTIEIMLICKYLHLPMKSIVTVLTEETTADFYINNLVQKEYKLKGIKASMSPQTLSV